MAKIFRRVTMGAKIACVFGCVVLVVLSPDWRVALRALDCEEPEPPPIDTVDDYANRCYERLEIQKSDVPDTFSCKAGGSKQLYVHVNGTIEDIHVGGAPNANAAKKFPSHCDKPAWLELGKSDCYGNSYIQKLTIGADVEGALLCRHKRTWSDGDKDFDDIALILHNRDNGQTCWFQTPDGAGTKRDGTNVPAPHTEDAKPFWHKPSTTASINCIRCHDSGPWMNSRWMNDNSAGLLKDRLGPYVNEGIGFKDWAKPTFVESGSGTCNTCHKIHAAATANDLKPYRTCSEWINRTVGRTYPRAATKEGKSFELSYWMPDGHGIQDTKHDKTDGEVAWDTDNKVEVDKLLACCTAKGVGVADCAVYNPPLATAGAELEAVASHVSAVRIFASRQGAPLSSPEYESVAPEKGKAHVVPSGTSLTVGWATDLADATCVVTASLPPGVRVAGTKTRSVGTATNWGARDAPQTVGPLIAPGQYRFTIRCDGQVSTSLTFEVGGTPATFLNIQAITNNVAAPAATNIGGRSHTTVNAHLTDTVYITWRADNVQENSCLQTETSTPAGVPTADSSSDRSGFKEVVLYANTRQTYSLSCLGNDGLSHTVNTTVRVAPD